MREQQISSKVEPSPPHWHALDAEQTLSTIESNGRGGLSSEEVRRRLKRLGPNTLPRHKRRSSIAILASQFQSPLIYLLFAAAAIALALGHLNDAIVIFVVVTLNALVGWFQEGRAERSLEALMQLATHQARAVRDGEETLLKASELVPGDIILLEAGDAVPADARLLHGASLQIAEAALTGESVPVPKQLSRLEADSLLADRHNMVYAGTHVTAGRGRAVVVATGLSTEIGRIAALASAAEQPKTPLERRIAQFGRYIIVAAAAMFVAVNVIGVLQGLPFSEIVMVAISQVVGMVPEGLPVAMTIALAVGVQRMAARKAVVRRLSAVETLGSTSVICSDKTGTLTRNEMTVTDLVLPNARELSVTGAGYAPHGHFLEQGERLDPQQDEAVRTLLEAAVLCSDANLQIPEGREDSLVPIGDPTQVALLTVALKAGLDFSELRERWPRRAEIPFDSAAKLMATQHDSAHGSRVLVKGAPEVLLKMCQKADDTGTKGTSHAAGLDPMEAAQRMAERALRVLAVGVIEDAELDVDAGFAPFDGKVRLLGLMGQIDPPRAEVKEAVRRCRDAGIRAVMVTGDHKATGHAIARALGMARDGDAAVDGRELEQMTDEQLAERIPGISVFARVHPAQKLRIVEAYQKRGEIVSMTGDGVNDAPALVKANVGVAMGITGTEVAKESAEIVISDDNFATIVAAVEEGRVVYRNIKKVVLYLFSTSMAEVLVLMVALLLGYPPPLAAVQILWINLVTEGAVTVNLIMEPAEGDEMRMKPISPEERLFTPTLLTRMAFMTPLIAASTLGWFVFRLAGGVPFAQVQTETFTVLALCQWFNVLNCRSERRSALDLSLIRNPWLIGGLVAGALLQAAVVFWQPLSKVFHTVPFGLQEALAMGLVASLVLWVEELRKLWVRWR